MCIRQRHRRTSTGHASRAQIHRRLRVSSLRNESTGPRMWMEDKSHRRTPHTSFIFAVTETRGKWFRIPILFCNYRRISMADFSCHGNDICKTAGKRIMDTHGSPIQRKYHSGFRRNGGWKWRYIVH